MNLLKNKIVQDNNVKIAYCVISTMILILLLRKLKSINFNVLVVQVK